MTQKVYDKYGKRRLVTIAFRASEGESKRLNDYVMASGLSKQDYIIKRLECQDVIVQGNPKVYIGLKTLLKEVSDLLAELAEKNDSPSGYMLDTINYITKVLEGMKGDDQSDKGNTNERETE